MTTETTNQLTVIERAQVALKAKDHEPKLRELAAKHADVTTITNAAGCSQVHAARMTLKSARVEIQKAGKAAREDFTAFSNAVISEEKRLIGIIAPEEERLLLLQSAWETKVEKEKQAAKDAEERRIEALRDRVASIRNFGFDVSHLPSDQIEQRIKSLVALEVGDDYQEQRNHANVAKQETLDKLRGLKAKAEERERAEAERVAAQQAEAKRLADLAAELEARQREQAERDRAEADRLAAERAKLEQEQAAARAAQVERDTAAAAERDRQQAEQRRLDQEREALEEQKRQAAENERREQLRKDAEEAERVRQQQAAEAERVRREQEQEANRKAELERVQRQAEIDSATLQDAAREAHALLVKLAPDHLVTAKLWAALSREPKVRAARATAKAA